MNSYQLHVTLRGFDPPIWRRVIVPGNMNLARLHSVIQDAMGWSDSHLHSFDVKGETYGISDPDGGDPDVHSETSSTARTRARFIQGRANASADLR